MFDIGGYRGGTLLKEKIRVSIEFGSAARTSNWKVRLAHLILCQLLT